MNNLFVFCNNNINQKRVEFSQELNSFLETSLAWLLGIEKKNFDSTYVSFEQHAQKIKEEIGGFLHHTSLQLEEFEKIIKIEFPKQEQNILLLDDLQKTWQEVKSRLLHWLKNLNLDALKIANESTFMQLFEIPGSFLDRILQSALFCIGEKRFHEAICLGQFLCFANPYVFEYWFDLAYAQKEDGQYENALQSYLRAMTIAPENPKLFFEIAHVCFLLHEPKAAEISLEECIKFCSSTDRELEKSAHDILSSLRSIKAM